MSRTVPYRVQCTKKCLQTQNTALNSTFFLLRQTGPTAFVLKDEHERIFKVFLGDQHQCTCFAFQREREVCKHMCWLLLKRFRIPRTNSMLWQRGLVEREINELLRGLTADQRKKCDQDLQLRHDDETEVEQRSIEETDVCPICQEEFLIRKLPISVTYCRRGCGNNVHVKCMKVWLDHQVSTGEKTIKCPLCRGTFGTPEQLKQEFRTTDVEQAGKASIHLGYSCHRCRACPIPGKCYKCTTCEDYFLCQTCFNLNIHNEHSFDYRERSVQRWKVAIREHLTALSNTLHQMLVNRDINQDDYETLLQLENAQHSAVMGIPENVVKAMPSEHVHEHSHLLQSDEQCRLCLRSYQLGDQVRRLPCRHKFHIDCIDGWLLHSHPTCPIDGQLVWSVEMENKQREVKRSPVRPSSKTTPYLSISSLIFPDMGLTILPYRPQTAISTASNKQFHRRALITSMPLEINARSIRNRPISAQVEHRQFRQQSLLSSSSFLTESIRRDVNQHSTFSANTRFHQHRRSHAK